MVAERFGGVNSIGEIGTNDEWSAGLLYLIR